MPNTRPINVLLIEDNPGDVVLMKEAFKELTVAYSLNVATDGEEAIDYLSANGEFADRVTPDFILLDLNLPKKDGREVLRFIRTSDDLCIIPVVILTTSNANQDILNSYRLNANAYLNKPVDFDKFFDTVKRIEMFWFDTAVLPTMLR